MRFFRKYWDKLFLKQWNIGFLEGNLHDMILRKQTDLKINWLKLDSHDRFCADPFIFKSKDGSINLLFEDFTFSDNYGKICFAVIDKAFKAKLNKTILDTKLHLSYPHVYEEQGKVYVIPEAGHSGTVSCFEFNPADNTLVNKKELLNMPLLDATLLKYNNRYWLFGTIYGQELNNKLYIYHADHLFGPYIPHVQNPVKDALHAARPAGNFIKIGSDIFRPSQNCSKYYGGSISINKIKVLNEQEFREEHYMELAPNKQGTYKYGFHTINSVDNIIVVDGLKKHFHPYRQLKNYLRNLNKLSASDTAGSYREQSMVSSPFI